MDLTNFGYQNHNIFNDLSGLGSQNRNIYNDLTVVGLQNRIIFNDLAVPGSADFRPIFLVFDWSARTLSKTISKPIQIDDFRCSATHGPYPLFVVAALASRNHNIFNDFMSLGLQNDNIFNDLGVVGSQNRCIYNDLTMVASQNHSFFQWFEHAVIAKP